jgi:hypothetical protein
MSTTGIEPIIALLKSNVVSGVGAAEAMALSTDASIAKTIYHMREAMNSLRDAIEIAHAVDKTGKAVKTLKQESPSPSSSPALNLSEVDILTIRDRSGQELSLDNGSNEKKMLNALIVQLCTAGLTLSQIDSAHEFRAFGFSPLSKDMPESVRRAMIYKLRSDVNIIMDQRMAVDAERDRIKQEMETEEERTDTPDMGFAPRPGQSKTKKKSLDISVGIVGPSLRP